ncbi:hypothetical protein [Legionella saoudiensis]|uniref:hypothetical protein n=1 Tax=Legionella saoudiensis TaxID=1750561 RepID=UPI00073117AD|nr:hypothetical protein [Legionella saoudiensis]
MNNKFQVPKIFETLIPFIIAGIAIALFIGLLFMFSYVVIWGLIIGGALWLISVVKELLFPSPKKTTIIKKTQGRIIEHDDKK